MGVTVIDSVSAIDPSTVLQLSCDGADGATAFPDDAARHSVTASGNAQVDTAQSKFGGASALYDGTGDYLSFSDNIADVQFGTAVHTIDMWVRFISLANRPTLYVQANGNDRYVLFINGTDSQGLTLSIYSASGPTLLLSLSQGAMTGWSVDTWYHVAVERAASNVWRLYRDGVVLATSTTSLTVPTMSTAARIGQGDTNGTIGSTTDLNGWTDEYRISNAARYNGAFTPPTAPYDD